MMEVRVLKAEEGYAVINSEGGMGRFTEKSELPKILRGKINVLDFVEHNTLVHGVGHLSQFTNFLIYNLHITKKEANKKTLACLNRHA